MERLHEVRNVSISILRSPQDVYAYAARAENLPSWASGLAGSIRRDGTDWIADAGPLGEVRVRFTPLNDLGVLDHYVTLPSGQTVHNPVRVIPNGEGSSVMFTLLRLPGVTPESFERDAKTVQKDLTTLKGLLEK